MHAHGWLGAYAAFVVRWVGMMAAMMLPSFLPRLWHYARAAMPIGPARGVGLAALAGAGYLSVWALLGALVYPASVAFGAAAAALPALGRATPMLAGAVVACAGGLQFTAWKSHHLACLRAPAPTYDSERYAPGAALRYGARLGVHCGSCGAGLTAVMLMLGTMDLRVMAAAAVAVVVERQALAGERVARVLGGVGVAAGLVMMAHGVYP